MERHRFRSGKGNSPEHQTHATSSSVSLFLLPLHININSLVHSVTCSILQLLLVCNSSILPHCFLGQWVFGFGLVSGNGLKMELHLGLKLIGF